MCRSLAEATQDQQVQRPLAGQVAEQVTEPVTELMTELVTEVEVVMVVAMVVVVVVELVIKVRETAGQAHLQLRQERVQAPARH